MLLVFGTQLDVRSRRADAGPTLSAQEGQREREETRNEIGCRMRKRNETAHSRHGMHSIDSATHTRLPAHPQTPTESRCLRVLIVVLFP